MRNLHSLAVACATLAFARPAAAQQSSDTARVAPVVVTATKSPLAVSRVPGSVSVVTGAELRAQGITHLTDALRGIPGLSVVQSGSYGAPASLFVRGGQSSYTKVLIDGVPANEPGAAFDFGTVTVDDVERIEVVRGPSSVVWGSDAVSAVVHIITRRGATDRVAVAARGGTYGTGDLSGSVERGSGAWRGAMTAAHHLSDGSHALNSDYRSSLVGGSATWAGSRGTTVRGNARFADLTAHFPTDFTGAPVDSNSYRDQQRTSASAELVQPLGAVVATLAAGHMLVVGSSVNPADTEFGTSTTFDTRTRRQQLELRGDAPLRSWLTLAAGGVVERQHRDAASNRVTTAAGGPGSSSRQETSGDRSTRGAYAELLGTTRTTTATLGARVDASRLYGTFGTWRAAMSHELPSATRLRASVGTAFREPTFDEVLPSSFSTGNPDLEPERSTSWEVGAVQQLAAGRVALGATYFQQRFGNMIDYFSATFPGRYENVAAARARGTELEARLVPAEGWSADASLTLVKTRVETAGFGGALSDGRALLRRPERSATAGLTRAGARGSLAARLAYVGTRRDVRYLYEAPYSAEETLPAYTKVDLSGELNVVARRTRTLALTMRIDNLTGASYEAAAGYAAPGRAFLAGVRAGF